MLGHSLPLDSVVTARPPTQFIYLGPWYDHDVYLCGVGAEYIGAEYIGAEYIGSFEASLSSERFL